MKLLNSTIAVVLFTALTSCSSTETIWVSGQKTECSNGAGKTECLNVYKGNDLENAKWENFYSKIDGFTFEEGYLQKIKVKTKQLDTKNVPADASSIQYNLVKVIEKKEDVRSKLNGSWTLVEINNKAISTTSTIPELNFDLKQNKIYGTDGCNNYSAAINNLSAKEIELGVIANTRKMCANMTLPVDYNHALLKVKQYKISNDTILFLLDENNNTVLRFVKTKNIG